MSAIDDVIFERKRQIIDEGWSDAHDDAYKDSELIAAAVSYLLATAQRAVEPEALQQPPSTWPWDPAWWKPKTDRQDLVRAAALIIAEIDRRDRDAA